MIRKVVTYGNPVLRQRAKEVDVFDKALRALADDMLVSMYAENGIGLAAPQVGHSIRMMVIDTRDSEQKSLVLINPVIQLGAEKVISEEGCLSFPGIIFEVERSQEIEVNAQDLEGKPMHFMAKDLLARVVQHELDHLNGILFIDYLNIVQKTLLSGKLKRLQKKTQAELSGIIL